MAVKSTWWNEQTHLLTYGTIWIELGSHEN
jgi:hypothetical protein